MLDYRAIEALHTIIELQSFEAAASKLFITQSAVSQRIKNLESFYNKPLLIRTLPYTPTSLGQHLIAHYKQVALLEDAFSQQLTAQTEPLHISIAINRDSLETWFLPLIKKVKLLKNTHIEIISDDQELTLDYLKKGLASAALSTSGKPLPNATLTFLGTMEYALVASPTFIKKHLSKKNKIQSLLNAPALKFDKNDNLHERFLEKFFDLHKPQQVYQTIPSVQGFKQFALNHLAYGLIPKIDIIQELKSNKLTQIYKDKTWKVPLYWHYYPIQSPQYQRFNSSLIDNAKQFLTN